MAILTSLILALALNTNDALHAPHDSSYGIASALLANGDVVTAIIHSEQQILVTHDGGYNWHIIGGEGLQLANATSITYHAGLSSSAGRGAFVVGTTSGVWTFEPDNNFAIKTSFGLHSADRSIISLDSPSHGTDGPAVAVTELGSVYLLDANTLSWAPVYQVSGSVRFATKIAIAPHASVANNINGDQDIFLAAAGQLHISHDLGQSWSIAPQFSNPALSLFDWNITSIDISDDYANDNTLMLGRGRLHASGLYDEGDIWSSSDSASSFNLVYNLGTAVTALLSTPSDSSGKRYWLAAGRQYPNYDNYFGTGILRSEDNGATWSDNFSAQDFLLEDEPGKKSGAEDMFFFSQLQVSANFSQNDEIMYGRQEGLFISRNSGEHWQQQATRFANRFRDVEATIDANGNDLVFGAGYGTGTVTYNATTDVSEIVPFRSPMVYQRRISISPNYDLDGRILVAGNVYLYEWQSTDVSPSNPGLEAHWYSPQVSNILANGRDAGYPRGVLYSPNFDPTASTAAADETFFWFSAQGQVRRTSDNGLTSERLFEDTLGAPTDTVQCLAVAPTYDANGSRTDAYAGTTGGLLYRLLDTQWLKLFDFGVQITKVVVDPNYRRPANPILFALSSTAPYVYRINDSLGRPSVQSMRYNLSGVLPTGIALNPNFKDQPIIYISTKASGAFQLDLSEIARTWVPFGNNTPLSAVDDICLSKNFATDGKAYLATNNGMMQLDSNNIWQDINGVFRIDDTDESISTYSPNNPNVIAPSHIWPWRSALRWDLPADLKGTGDEVLFADYDGDYFTCPVRGTSVGLMTFQGPRLGEVLLELIEPSTNLVVASQTYDLLESAANASELIIDLNIPDPSKVYTFKVTAHLDPSELVAIDGVEITLN